ncbi:MAG: hypothetical protein OXJ37_14430 [Bryobacterales bacterium]|nr:hypothetical protein [Bryobacterales bacterium]
MKFSELLTETVRNAEIPLRFEPGAEEAIVEPVTDLLKRWVAIHDPNSPEDDFEYGQRALVLRLLEELDGQHELPVSGE